MKIIDILVDSASFLGLNEEVKVLLSTTKDDEVGVLEGNEKIASLFNLVKFSIRELCTNYFPMISNETIKTENKTYPISSIENYIRLQNVFEKENMIKFKIINRNIIFENDGEYNMVYETYPTINSLFDELDFLQEFSPDVIVFGLCAYFSLAHGMFAEFEDFHEQYVSKAESLKNLKSVQMPCRRWE